MLLLNFDNSIHPIISENLGFQRISGWFSNFRYESISFRSKMMKNRETVEKLQPTNADLMRYILDGRKEVRQLQKNLNELTSMVKLLQRETPRSPRLSLDTSPKNNRMRIPSEKLSSRESSTNMFLLRNVDFTELEMACNGWSDILGLGGFGEVYKGRWNGQDIAVKRLRNNKRPRDVQGTKFIHDYIFTQNNNIYKY